MAKHTAKEHTYIVEKVRSIVEHLMPGGDPMLARKALIDLEHRGYHREDMLALVSKFLDIRVGIFETPKYMAKLRAALSKRSK